MAYEKQTWNSGDTITAQKLNHMEDGIAGGTLVIGGFSSAEGSPELVGTSDKTWQEIYNAMVAGVRCVVVIADTDGCSQLTITASFHEGGVYGFGINHPGGSYTATTTSADGYPAARGVV